MNELITKLGPAYPYSPLLSVHSEDVLVIDSIKCQHTFTFQLPQQDLLVHWLARRDPPKVAQFKTISYLSLFLGVLPYSKISKRQSVLGVGRTIIVIIIIINLITFINTVIVNILL